MKLNKLQREELLTALRTLQNEGPVDRGYGICYNLDQLNVLSIDPYLFVSSVSVSWPGITGRVETDDYGNATSSYPIAFSYINGYREPLWEGDQLCKRAALIAYLIDWLERYPHGA